MFGNELTCAEIKLIHRIAPSGKDTFLSLSPRQRGQDNRHQIILCTVAILRRDFYPSAIYVDLQINLFLVDRVRTMPYPSVHKGS